MSGRRSVAGRPYAGGGAGRTIASGAAAGGGGGGGGSVTVVSVSPTEGAAGLTGVVITGTNFTAGDAVTLNGVSCTVTAQDATTKTITVPASVGTSGTAYDIVVAGVTLAGAFTWYAAPDILNNIGFGAADWGGLTKANGGTPTGVSLSSTEDYDGSGYSVKRTMPVTSGSDVGGSCYYEWIGKNGAVAVDRVWVRFYVFLDATPDGIQKFGQFWEASSYNQQLSGFGIFGGNLVFNPIESVTRGHSHTVVALATLNDGNWHCIEADYWRNGDTSNGGHDYPSVAVWVDGVQKTLTAASGEVFANGRLNVGARDTSQKLGVYQVFGLTNGSPANTVETNVYVDRLALSSVGRIGP